MPLNVLQPFYTIFLGDRYLFSPTSSMFEFAPLVNADPTVVDVFKSKLDVELFQDWGYFETINITTDVFRTPSHATDEEMFQDWGYFETMNWAGVGNWSFA